MNAVIVGAGISGLTAGVLLKRAGYHVQLFENRAWIGGNCADTKNGNLYVCRYGPHIFHTKKYHVWEFLSKFTDFNSYVHRVMARVKQYPDLLPIPYCKTTQEIVGRDLTDDEIRKAFFEGYSEKMWGVPFDQLPESIRKRVSLRRDDYDTRYFTDEYQGMPLYGYTMMFDSMLDEIGRCYAYFGVGPNEWRIAEREADVLVYTGRLDEYFDHAHGKLPYRSLNFDFCHASKPKFPCAVVNYCDAAVPHTRKTDYSWFYKDSEGGYSAICTETPMADSECGILAYPMDGFAEVQPTLYAYKQLASEEAKRKKFICGRMGSYRYMNMDDAVASVMEVLNNGLQLKA